MSERAYTDLELYRRLLRMARPYWSHIGGALGLSLLATPLALLVPVPLKIAVDNVIGSQPLPGFIQPLVPGALATTRLGLLAFAAALVVVIALLSQLRTLATTLLQNYSGEKLLLEFRGLVFRHAQRLSFTYHDKAGSYDSLYRIQYDTSAIQRVTVDGYIPLVTAAITVLAMLYVTARIDTHLALVALVIVPMMVGLTSAYRRRLRPKWRDVKKLESSAIGVVQEVLSSLRVVQAFGQEEREQERFVHQYRQGLLARLRLLVTQGGFDLLMGLTVAAGTAAILFIGVRHVLSGTLTLGALLLVMSYIGQLYNPLKTMGQKVGALQNALASAERAFSLLDLSPEVSERPDARSLERSEGRITLERVSFAYGDIPTLRDVDLDVAPGTKVGIAGPTGAGKTTLLGLVIRFFDPTSGRVLLDGVDVRDYRLDDLRSQFAIVLQETVLFSTTIAENIAYARPEADLQEIEAAARAANAHDFIATFPNGYDTVVGERGMRLSGGERQRIALARAFLKDAPILILDEPTSSVDMITEASIMEAMDRLTVGRTTLVIAHRLRTLADCDILIFVDRGRVALQTTRVSETISRLGGPGDLDDLVNAFSALR